MQELDPIQTLKIVVFDSGFFDRWYDIAKKNHYQKSQTTWKYNSKSNCISKWFFIFDSGFFHRRFSRRPDCDDIGDKTEPEVYRADHVAQAAGAVHPRPGPIRRATITMRPTVSRAGDDTDAGGGAAAADSAGPSASAPLTAWAGPPRGPTASPRAVPSRRRRG